jgi:hypothetical protein
MCIVVLKFITPAMTSPVQTLKRLKGKESENLTVVMDACACTDVGPSKAAASVITTNSDNLTPNSFPKLFIANLLRIPVRFTLLQSGAYSASSIAAL